MTQRDQPVTGGDTTHTYQYDNNGSLRRRKLLYTDSLHPSGRPLWDEHERYSYRGLFTWSHRTDSLNNIFDWRYRYSASGEREQKRLVYTTVWDSVMGYPWVYYLLGGNNQQLAVYHGQQVSDTKCGKTGRRVYMYPVEYLSYGVGSVMSFTTDANGVKQYKIADHLGSTRLAVSGAGTDGQYNYAPYGKREVVAATSATRKGFIDREQDVETGLGNFGVRAFDEDEGVFFVIDPRWEKYRALNPYGYAGNSPIANSDPNGDTIVFRGGSKAFREVVKGYVKYLRDHSAFARFVIEQLEKSKNMHIIQIESGNVSLAYPYVNGGHSESELASNGVGVGSLIRFNPYYKSTAKNPSERGPGYVYLFSEMGHSWLMDNGAHSFDKWFQLPGKDQSNKSEIVVHGLLENIVRGQLGLPFRTTYGGVSLDIGMWKDPKNLQKFNVPIKPKW